jgi:hypothetical protein
MEREPLISDGRNGLEEVEGLARVCMARSKGMVLRTTPLPPIGTVDEGIDAPLTGDFTSQTAAPVRTLDFKSAIRSRKITI